MSQSLAKVTIHLVFSTKNRKPVLGSAELQHELHAYMATVLRENVDSPALIINGVEDHIHALISLSRKYAIMDVVKEAKTETSKWLKSRSGNQYFAWQSGYGVFSVSQSNVSQVRRYIERQKEHHERMNYQDEFRALCERHEVELDERYAWD